MKELANHDWDHIQTQDQVLYENRPCLNQEGQRVDGLHSAWITLNNPQQLNAYSTDMIKAATGAFKKASVARDVVAVVFTGAGDRAFCTGGDVMHYAEYYAGRPDEFRSYMRLFSDLITSILTCDKPVINRVNGMRIGGGQELGMACDLSISSDLALFGQAGPRHGSSPVAGATDFLPLFVGIEHAMKALTIDGFWSAHKALRMGLLSQVCPVLKVEGQWQANPLVETNRWVDQGQIIFGEALSGDDYQQGKAQLKAGQIDFSLLDQAVEKTITDFLHSFPACISHTLESTRHHKRDHWDRCKEDGRAWLGLNMMTEAKAGFQAFAQAPSKDQRQIDFIKLRQALARGEAWSDELIESIKPTTP